jgi:hypothetical protein
MTTEQALNAIEEKARHYDKHGFEVADFQEWATILVIRAQTHGIELAIKRVATAAYEGSGVAGYE